MNTAQKGAHRERRTRARLVNDGYEVLRSAASKSCIDLLGIKGPQILMIQVKSGVMSRVTAAEWNELYRLASGCGAVPLVVLYQDRRPATWWRITGPRLGDGRRSPCVPFTLDEVASAAAAG